MLATLCEIWRWELRSFFGRPGGWLILMAATLPAAISAGWLAALVSRGGLALRADDDPVSQFLGPNVFLISTLLWLVPLLTMNGVADDRRRGTWELLITTPSSLNGIILGKFLAAWTLLLGCLAPWPLLLGMLRFWNGKPHWIADWFCWFDGPGIEFDPGLWLGGVLGLALVSATFAALGTLASAIAKRPVTAALATATGLALLLAVSFVPRVLEQWRFPASQTDWLQPLAVWGHLTEFSRGMVPVNRICQHLSAVSVLLWLAVHNCRHADG